MSSALSNEYTCPNCDARFDAPSKYCRKCGSSMDSDSLDGESRAGESLDGESLGGEDIATDDTAFAAEPLDVTSEHTDSGPSFRRRVSDRERDAWLGRVVDNRYRVIEIIGRGGMGMVYKVEHQRMGKIAAMKVLHTDLAERPRGDGVGSSREAEAVSRLNHPEHGAGVRLRHGSRGQPVPGDGVRARPRTSSSHLIDRDGRHVVVASEPHLMFMPRSAPRCTEAHLPGRRSTGISNPRTFWSPAPTAATTSSRCSTSGSPSCPSAKSSAEVTGRGS